MSFFLIRDHCAVSFFSLILPVSCVDDRHALRVDSFPIRQWVDGVLDVLMGLVTWHEEGKRGECVYWVGCREVAVGVHPGVRLGAACYPFLFPCL